MKKLIYAAGVLSLGGVHFAVQAAEGSAKPWSVGLTTQGFYDDNINTAPDGPNKIGSWGTYVSPNGSYSQTWDQTTLNLGASYGAYYYANAEGTLASDWSQTASFLAALNHTFNPRMSLDLKENFTMFQNANQVLLGQTGRINGNNIGNDASANLSTELTSRLSVVTGYENVLFRYEEDQYAALLDRVENYGRFDLRYLITPSTVGVVGTKVGNINYDSGLAFNPSAPVDAKLNPSTSIKDNMSYFVYGGFDHSFSPAFTGSLRAGAQVQDFYNYTSAATGQDYGTEIHPYVDVSLSYAFQAGSTAQVGVIHRANPTDITGSYSVQGFQPTLQQVSTAFYGNISHAITSKLTGSLMGTFQTSEFVDGYNGVTEQWWSLGANLSYALVKNVSLTAAYYYDLLNDDTIASRNYNRNRVFFGISASY